MQNHFAPKHKTPHESQKYFIFYIDINLPKIKTSPTNDATMNALAETKI